MEQEYLQRRTSEALTLLFDLYDKRVDVYGMIDNMPLAIEAEDSAEAAISAIFAYMAKKTGYNLGESSLLPQEIEKTELPLLVSAGGEIYLQLPEKTHSAVLHLVGKGKSEKKLSELFDENEKLFVWSLTPVDVEPSLLDRHLNWKKYKWFWDQAANYRSHMGEVVLCSLFMNIFALALPLYTMNVYDRVVVSFAEATLIALTFGVVLVIGFDFLFRFVRSYILERCSSGVGVSHDVNLMERLFHISPARIGMSVGEIANLFRELQGAKNFFMVSFISSIVDFPFFFLFLLIIYLISPAVAMVPLVGMISVLVLHFLAHRSIGQSTKQHLEIMQQKNKMLVELLNGMPSIQATGSFGNRLLQWKQNVTESGSLLRKHAMIMSLVTSLSGSAVQLVQVMVILVGVYQINGSSLTIGGLIACSILSGRAMAVVMRLPEVVSQSKKALEVLELAHPIFDYDIDHDRAPKDPMSGGIKFDAVNFFYPGTSRPALQNIDISIKKGEKIGIIGMSGAGKTTLANLMAGMDLMSGGDIWFDDIRAKSIPATQLRSSIGYLPQEPYYFAGSVRDNIRMGRDVSEEELKHLSAQTGLDQILKLTGEGLDTAIEAGGRNLSPGQRQSVAITRSLVGNPAFIVFDEPTTGMDSKLEAVLKQRLPELLGGRTFIMATHKTTLLPMVDRLLVLDNGKLIADGMRDEILNKLGANKSIAKEVVDAV